MLCRIICFLLRDSLQITYAKISWHLFIEINATRLVLDFWRRFQLLRKKTIGRDICGGQDICDKPNFYPQTPIKKKV